MNYQFLLFIVVPLFLHTRCSCNKIGDINETVNPQLGSVPPTSTTYPDNGAPSPSLPPQQPPPPPIIPPNPKKIKEDEMRFRIDIGRKNSRAKFQAIEIKSAILNYAFDLAQEKLKSYSDLIKDNEIDQSRISKISEQAGFSCSPTDLEKELAAALEQTNKDKSKFKLNVKEKKVGLILNMCSDYYRKGGKHSFLSECMGNKQVFSSEDEIYTFVNANYKVSEDQTNSFDKFNRLITKDIFPDQFYNTIFCVIDHDNRGWNRTTPGIESTRLDYMIGQLGLYYKKNMVLLVLSKTIEDNDIDSQNFILKDSKFSDDFGKRFVFFCTEYNRLQKKGEELQEVQKVKAKLLKDMCEQMRTMEAIKIGSSHK